MVTRGEPLELIRRLTDALREAGLGPGRAVAVRTEVTPEAFAAHMAAHVLGCRVVGIRPGYPPGQLEHVLGMGVDAVVVDPATAMPRLLRAGTPLSLGPVPGATDLLARRHVRPDCHQVKQIGQIGRAMRVRQDIRHMRVATGRRSSRRGPMTWRC
ncbi:AMP-binding protein [Nonomuraea fuscirosea]